MIVKRNGSFEDEAAVLVGDNTQKISSNLITMDHIEPADMFDSYNNFDLNVDCVSQKEKESTEANEFVFENPPLEAESSESTYCLLPKEFFSNSDVPPPLVCKSWLSLVYRKIRKKETDLSSKTENENIAEDSLPLSQLKHVLKKNTKDITIKQRPQRKGVKTYKILESCDSDSDSQLNEFSDNEYLRESKTEKKSRNKSKNSDVLVINRKRGRPKKASQLQGRKDLEPNQLDGSSQKDNIDDWWYDDRNDSDLDIPWQSNSVQSEEVTDSLTISNYQEHDYSKTENEKSDENSGQAISKKKKKKVLICETDGKSKLVFPCSECSKSFSAASTLKYHMRIHNGALIKCTECDKGFTTNYLLKCHMRIHNGDLFMCHKCGRGFTTAELLKVHSRGHTGDRPFTCHICGKAFPSASNLRQHKETHEVVKKYLCFQCGSSFSQKRCLDGHMLSHGEKNHICTVCGKLWARKSDLTEHMRVHTGSKPYSCNLCPQKFTQASSLRRHQIVHMEAKPIPCLTCGRLFKCEDYFKRHMKKHEKDSNEIAVNIKQ